MVRSTGRWGPQFACSAPRSVALSCRLSSRKEASLIPVAASMVDHGTSRPRNPLNGSHPTPQLTLPASSLDQLLHVVHHVSSTTRHVAAQRRDERRPMLVGLRGEHVSPSSLSAPAAQMARRVPTPRSAASGRSADGGAAAPSATPAAHFRTALRARRHAATGPLPGRTPAVRSAAAAIRVHACCAIAARPGHNNSADATASTGPATTGAPTGRTAAPECHSPPAPRRTAGRFAATPIGTDETAR